jgi:beta-xylosidase
MRLQIAVLTLCLTTPAILFAEDHYLFSYFKGNGEDGLHLAHSTDGIRWRALNQDRSLLTPTVGKDRLMRDPSIVRGPNGTFHMVWTTGWHDQGIGVAHSKDLIEWSAQERIGVMDHEARCRNCWAPEIFYEELQQRYLIFWASTIEGRFPETAGSCESNLNHRMYFVTTKDFRTFSKTRLFFDPGFPVIDSCLVRDGNRYVLVSKNETRFPEPQKNLFAAAAAAAQGPYQMVSKPFSPDWVEGPSVLRVGDRWLVYFDEYTRHRYRAMQTRDFAAWEAVEPAITHPPGMRHGTAFAVSQEIAAKLLQL